MSKNEWSETNSTGNNSFQWYFLTWSQVKWADIENYVEFLSKEIPDIKIEDRSLFEVERRLDVYLNSNKLEQLEHQHAEKLVKDGLSINKVASSGIPVYRATNLQMERRGLQSCQNWSRADIRSQSSSVDETRFEKAENAYLSSFTSKKSKTLPGATAAAHGDPKWQE
ncbi:hypothetical protein TNCV_755191 [Trichonephila clavipes]|nr:hypothetical protein TNCV_755191 [Trichonephila clavipes]